MLWSQGTLENVKPPCLLLGRAEISQDEWGKTRMLWKPPFSGRRTWTTPSWISLPWVLPAACPTSDFQGSRFLGSRSNSSREWWPPNQLTQAGSLTLTPMLGEYLSEKLTLKPDPELPKPSGLWGAPLVSGILPEALLCSPRQFFNNTGPLFHASY